MKFINTLTVVATVSSAATLMAYPQPQSTSTAAVTGTYGLGTRQRPSLSRDGCWLEAAQLTADSVRVQVRCSIPPAHHLGVLDERLSFRSGTAVYEVNRSSERCRITVRFVDAQAMVVQEGSDRACGFGAYVNVGGTYGRISRQRPPFDLFPIERQR